MIRRRSQVLLVLLAACGGGASPSPVRPASTAQSSAQAFLQAVADSNVKAMAGLWGTSAGPALSTNRPADWEKRLTVAQAFLRGAPFRIAREMPVEGQADQVRLDVELDRTRCTRTVPFTMIRLKDGSWIVTAIDLTAAGTPARPCDQMPLDRPQGNR